MNDEDFDANDTFNKKRYKRLATAELIDSLRVFPRLLVLGYIIWIFVLVNWYFNIPTHEKTTCEPEVLQTMLDNGASIEQAKETACSVTDVVGGATAENTSFVTIICGLSSAIFGFYVKSGRSWKDSIKVWNWRQQQASNRNKQENPPDDQSDDPSVEQAKKEEIKSKVDEL